MTESTPVPERQPDEMIDNLPESGSWGDVVYEEQLRTSMEHGLTGADAGDISAVEDLLKDFGMED